MEVKSQFYTTKLGKIGAQQINVPSKELADGRLKRKYEVGGDLQQKSQMELEAAGARSIVVRRRWKQQLRRRRRGQRSYLGLFPRRGGRIAVYLDGELVYKPVHGEDIVLEYGRGDFNVCLHSETLVLLQLT